MPLFEKIIDELVTIPQVHDVRLNGLNEPLLDRFLDARYEYIASKQGRFVSTLTTHGVYLTPKRVASLVEAGVAKFIISLNASTPAEHEAQMGLKGKFDIVCTNIQHCIDRGLDVEVRGVVNDDLFPMSSGMALVKRWGWKRYGGHVKLIRELNWATQNRTIRTFDPNECCVRAVAGIFIRWDGVITTCCVDPYGNGYQFGDLKTQTIREVYNSPEYVAFRLAHSENKAAQFGICKDCTRG
jgi:MoaA/NifB/PqqE/SkfB family radical SAM enzyme